MRIFVDKRVVMSSSIWRTKCFILLQNIDLPQWKVAIDSNKIVRIFSFKDFKESMNFVNKVADLAENEGHHPDILINYNKVSVELTTHAVGGLSVNDFILASKIDQI